MNPNPDDWRDRITALAGGATLEAMLADVARTTEHAHSSDPAEALARALLAAATGSPR